MNHICLASCVLFVHCVLFNAYNDVYLSRIYVTSSLMMYANKVERNKESHDSRELISGNTKCLLSHMKQKYESE